MSGWRLIHVNPPETENSKDSKLRANLVSEVVSIAAHIDDTDNIEGGAQKSLVAEGLEDHTADTTETVDSNFDRHD